MKPYAAILAALLVGGIFLLPATASAYWYWGSKPLAMGGAFSAVANDINTMQWNPAGLAFLNERKQVGIQFNYERQEMLFGDSEYLFPDLKSSDSESDFTNDYFYEDRNTVDPKKKMKRDLYHLAVADGYVNPFVAVGMDFTGLNFPSTTFKEGRDFCTDLTIAGGMEDIFSLGATGRYVDVSSTSNGEFDMDFGALFKAVGILGFGLVGRNVFGNDEPRIIRRELAFGLAGYILNYATISTEITKVFDVSDVPGTFNFAVGAEGLIAKIFALRGGFNWDRVNDTRLYSLGAAYTDKYGTLSYTFQGDTQEVLNFTHSIELTVYFP
ncbi:MAG: hypothetical protein GX444_16560 [Myxococcales bacterium]|nr:hypothetical protein [Myxococcales bacterium]